jgi:plastocyanin
MSDETPTPADEQPADATADTPAAAVATEEPPVTPAVPEAAAHPAVAVERPTFRNKFLMPLIVPLAVAATIVFYILNVSRVFLAGEDALAVIFASVITVVILVGGSALAASPKVRSSSLTLIIGGAFLVLLMGGLVSIGNASPNVASGPVQCTPVKGTVNINAGPGGLLKYAPSAVTVKAGCDKISMTLLSRPHTVQFDDPAVASLFPELTENQTSWAGNLVPGTYKFHCTIPGHETAGMIGTLTVTK